MQDLAYGSITDMGAYPLADCLDLMNLEYLDLYHNASNDNRVALHRATDVKLRADDQPEPGDDSHFCEGEIE